MPLLISVHIIYGLQCAFSLKKMQTYHQYMSHSNKSNSSKTSSPLSKHNIKNLKGMLHILRPLFSTVRDISVHNGKTCCNFPHCVAAQFIHSLALANLSTCMHTHLYRHVPLCEYICLPLFVPAPSAAREGLLGYQCNWITSLSSCPGVC